jgi:trypsin-like peptidase
MPDATLDPARVCEVLAALPDGRERRGSGYRIRSAQILTAAHLVAEAATVKVRFDADLLGERTFDVSDHWSDTTSDLAVLTIPAAEDDLAPALFGRLSDRAAVVGAQAVGFPLWKMRNYDGTEVLDDDIRARYRDSHQAVGSVAVLSNRRQGTLEVTVAPPERDLASEHSPWEGMSGSALWVGDRIVGVVSAHHRSDGLGRLTAVRIDRNLRRIRKVLAITGGLPDMITPTSAAESTITAYSELVRDIAPEFLFDREHELDALVQFCAAGAPYCWWQAGPWAGKSALMAWFASHPPAGVDVVSFFVTARLAGQSDSDAYTNAMIEQLAALAGESPSQLMTLTARHGHLLRLLKSAAAQAREAGRRILIVIDGLDEDMTANTTTGRSSIAALLPRRPPPEVRIVVSSRPTPQLPDDVPGDHPLHHVSPQPLDVSPHARNLELRAKTELTQALRAGTLHRDILGFVTAAGGGLSLQDLEYLTGHAPWEIEDILGGVFGRTVGSRLHAPDAVQATSERLYLLTHETLRILAEQQLGKALTTYRDHIHTWADTFRRNGWPPTTPTYLLRGYPRMLAGVDDRARLVACATDPTRHNRMLDLTGGDALALDEIGTAQQSLLGAHDLDLASVIRISVQRDHLAHRNVAIPAALPAVWLRLDHAPRAQALANSITDPESRVEALTHLLKTAITLGDPAGGPADRFLRQAEQLIHRVADPEFRAEFFAQLVRPAAAIGDLAAASRLTNEAVLLANQLDDPDAVATTFCALIDAANTIGDQVHVGQLLSAVEDAVREDIESEVEGWAARRLVTAYAELGHLSRAEELANRLAAPEAKANALVDVVESVIARRDPRQIRRLADLAEEAALRIASRAEQVYALARLVNAVGKAEDPRRKTRVAELAVRIADDTTDPYERSSAFSTIAETLVIVGERRQAHDLMNLIDVSFDNEYVLVEMAKADADAREYRNAQDLVERIQHVLRPELLTYLAQVAAVAGDRSQAEEFARQAETTARSLEFMNVPAPAYTSLVELLAAENPLLAGEFAAQIPSSYASMDALTRVAEVVAATGDCTEARRLTDLAETLADALDENRRDRVLARLMTAAAATGDLQRARALASRIIDPAERAAALTKLVTYVPPAQHQLLTELIDENQSTIADISDINWSLSALAALALAVDAQGGRERAAALIASAEDIALGIQDPATRLDKLMDLRTAVAETATPHQVARLDQQARIIAEQLEDSAYDDDAIVGVIEAVAASGDLQRAENLVNRITERESRDDALAGLAETIGVTDIQAAKVLISRISGPQRRDEAEMDLVAALGEAGELRQLEKLLNEIVTPKTRAEAAGWLLSGGAITDSHRASQMISQCEDFARQTHNQDHRGQQLARVAAMVQSAGLAPDRARRLLAEALTLTSWPEIASSLGLTGSSAPEVLATELLTLWRADT